MNTWFTIEPMIQSILKLEIDVISMVKQQYCFRGRLHTLLELQKFVNYGSPSNIFDSLHMTTKKIPVKIVFLCNRNKKSECLYLLNTNILLSDSEIVRIYGNRRSIECFFKPSKPFMKLGTEFQCRCYSAMVSHTTIVFVRYIFLRMGSQE